MYDFFFELAKFTIIFFVKMMGLGLVMILVLVMRMGMGIVLEMIEGARW